MVRRRRNFCISFGEMGSKGENFPSPSSFFSTDLLALFITLESTLMWVVPSVGGELEPSCSCIVFVVVQLETIVCFASPVGDTVVAITLLLLLLLAFEFWDLLRDKTSQLCLAITISWYWLPTLSMVPTKVTHMVSRARLMHNTVDLAFRTDLVLLFPKVR